MFSHARIAVTRTARTDFLSSIDPEVSAMQELKKKMAWEGLVLGRIEPATPLSNTASKSLCRFGKCAIRT